MITRLTVGQLEATINKLRREGLVSDDTPVVIDTEGIDPEYAVMIAYTANTGTHCVEDIETWYMSHGEDDDPPEVRCFVVRAT